MWRLSECGVPILAWALSVSLTPAPAFYKSSAYTDLAADKNTAPAGPNIPRAEGPNPAGGGAARPRAGAPEPDNAGLEIKVKAIINSVEFGKPVDINISITN